MFIFLGKDITFLLKHIFECHAVGNEKILEFVGYQFVNVYFFVKDRDFLFFFDLYQEVKMIWN